MRRNIPIFTPEQTDRLIVLNRHLTELEYWCLVRTKSLVEDYRDVADTPIGWGKGEDFELESRIEYYRAEPLDEEQEELILQTSFLPMPPFKWYHLKPTPEQEADLFELLHNNWSDGVEDIPRLNEERICWSFHDLHDHHRLDWQQVLEIERVWLDVHAIHQVETRIGKPIGVLHNDRF
ncbi:hypothetical protein [Pseudomonas sp. 273]|uniref:hypothetical protein n=1 Tax=Pseudomonas sp. 273 TaxID=75692 RepID=UPI0023D7EFC6|nr:hypothetical protein [Pseudomonas sp. 273]